MAYWGQALVLGPNINALMEPNEEPQALELVQKAVSLKSRASERERAYIDALARRYSGSATDRTARDRAATMLYVESVMDLRPWGYWQGDGTPHEGIAEIVTLTEQVIARNARPVLRIDALRPLGGDAQGARTTFERRAASGVALRTRAGARGHGSH
jgi:hypothetical protein